MAPRLPLTLAQSVEPIRVNGALRTLYRVSGGEGQCNYFSQLGCRGCLETDVGVLTRWISTDDKEVFAGG